MTKRRFAWIAVVLVALAALVLGVFGLSGTRTIRVDEAMLQKHIDAQLPKTHKGVTIEKAVVHLVDHDLHVTTTATGKAFGQQFSLDAFGIGSPEYRPDTQAFYVHPTKLDVTRLDLSGESAVDKTSKLLQRYLTDPRIKERAMGTLPGVKLWIEDNIVPRALERLSQMPLYKPKNDLKGVIIKATLSGITVDKGAVVLVFSLLQLTISVVIALFALVASLGLMFTLARNPGWGVPVMTLVSLS